MSKERERDLGELLGAVMGEVPTEPEPEPSAFAAGVGAALRQAVASMRAEGTIEMEADNEEGLLAELTETALDSNSPKQMVKRVIRTLIHSEHVEEVYGTDDELQSSLRRLFDGA